MLIRWQSTIVDRRGNVQPGAVLTIRRESDQAVVTVFKDRDGASPYPTGSVAADENGFAYFYAAPDLYRISSIGPVIDWRDVNLQSPNVSLGGTTYGSVEDGLAGTPDGKYFSVAPSSVSGGLIDLYRNDAGIATLIGTYPSFEAVEQAVSIAESLKSVYGVIWGRERNWRAPVYEFGDLGRDDVVDAQGNVIGGPAVGEILKAQIDASNAVIDGLQAQAGGRAPVYAFGQQGDDYVVDIDGNVMGGLVVTNYIMYKLDEGGNDNPALLEPAEPVYVEAGVLKVVGAAGVDAILDPTPYTFQLGAFWRGKAAVTAIDRASVSSVTPVAVQGLPDWATVLTLPSGSTLLIVIPSYGQSNSIGAQGFVPPSILTQNKWQETLLMLDGPGFVDVRMGLPSGQESPGSETALDPASITGFKPLVAMQSELVPGLGATPLEGMAYTFANIVHEQMGIDPRVCVFAAGWGGRFWDDLSQGTIPYQNMMTALAKIKQMADARGWAVWVPFVALVHGESDSSRTSFLETIVTVQAAMEADIKAITGQESSVPYVCTQASTFTGNANINGVLAPYNAVRAHPDKFVLSAPYYPYPMATDNLHLGVSAPLLGEKIAHGAARALQLFGSASNGTIMPISVTYDGDVNIDVKFHVPVLPLVRDTVDAIVNNPAPANWGFRVRNGSGTAVAISSISIVSGDTVRIVVDSAPSVGGFRSVDYGLSGYPTIPKVTGEQPRGQLRDSDAAISYVTGQRLYNWCPHFREFF